MTQEQTKSFVPETKKAGDILRSQDWNAAMDEIARLNATKLNRLGDANITGALTVQQGLQVQGNLSVPSGSLSLGAANPVKKLQIEQGELRIRASHNDATPDVAAFLSKDLTQGIGIGSNTITAIGESANQDITLAPKGNGSLSVAGSLKLAKGPAINELSIDGTLTDNSDSILPTQRAVRTYVDTKLSSFEAIDLKAKSLTVAGGLEVKGNIKVGGIIEQPTWQPAKLESQSNWATGGGKEAGFFKDSMGIVHLRGFVSISAGAYATGNIITLPEGYRPARTLYFAAASTHINQIQYVEINTDGRVSTPLANWVSLDIISFRAEK